MTTRRSRSAGRATTGCVVLASLLLGAAGNAQAAGRLPTGTFIEGVACRADPTQTYTLYLPSAYTPDRTWPTLVILDPRGRSVRAAELFRDAAETYGWILLSSNDTRSDAPAEPSMRAVNAMIPDAVHRYASNPKRLYLAGFSGGAIFAWETATQTGLFAGVISSGGRYAPLEFSDSTSFASFGTTGTTDFNYLEMHRVDAIFAARGLPHRLEVFDGPHSWMPEAMARQGVEWMELIAMKQGLRPRDDALVERLYAADLAAGRALDEEGEKLAAMRRYDAVAATFDGLRDVSEPRARAEKLRGSAAVRAALKAERHWERFEVHCLGHMWDTLVGLRAADAMVATGPLLATLRVAELKKRATEPGIEGITARRVLSSLFTQTAFYMTRDFFAAKRYAAVEQVLTIAAAIREDSPIVWYNLACARARLGKGEEALDALQRAVDEGFADLALVRADADLASLHGTPRFQALLTRLESASPRK